MTAAAAATTTVGASGERRRSYPTGWWGIVAMIMTEAMIFAGLISSYFYVRASSPEWPLGGIEPPELVRISWFTVVLLGSSVPIFWAEAGIRKGDQRRLRLGLLASFLLGVAFMVNLVLEYEELHFLPGDNVYASLFYATTGLHGLHVVVGLLMNLVVQIKAWQGKFSAQRHLTVEVFSLYWHFVDVVWIAVFTSLYLTAGL